MKNECNMLKIIMVQGFCPLKIKITQFPDGFRLFFTELIKGFTHPKLFLLLLLSVIQWTETYTVRLWFCGCTTSYMNMYVLVGVWSWFYSCEIERDRHYAKWKKAVKRTMKWEVNDDDEDQGKKIWSNSIYHHNCMFVFTLVCLLHYRTVTWNRQ